MLTDMSAHPALCSPEPPLLRPAAVMLGSNPLVDLLGMVAGHAYYFLEDVYPRMTGRRLLKTPAAVRALFPADGVQAPRMAPAAGLVPGAAPAAGAGAAAPGGAFGDGFGGAEQGGAAPAQPAAAAGGDRPHAD